jgi:hypothetical protein
VNYAAIFRIDQSIAATWLQPLQKGVGKKVYYYSISFPYLPMAVFRNFVSSLAHQT